MTRTTEPTDPRVWEVREPPGAVADLGRSPLLTRLLALRGVTDAESARRYLDPQLRDLPDPSSLTDLDAAAERLAAACEAGEHVAVHGDYDVDGIVSTTLLVDFLQRVGRGQVTPSLPNRMRDGYGISVEQVDRLADAGCTLLVTCDCGSTSHAPLERAVQRGMDTVILDHHRLAEELPTAVALVNPERGGGHEDLRSLCATGVVFMTVVALRRTLRNSQYFQEVEEPNLKHYLDLVALATVADMVPLVGANRLLVKVGLQELAYRRRPGIAALLEVSDVAPDAPLTASVFGFRLGPRINAAGRLADPGLALELLLTSDRGRAGVIAADLDRINQRRRQLEDRVLEEALAMVAADPDLSQKRALALMGEGWHPGVVGIVASRVSQRFHRPTLLLAPDGETATGSARSIKGVDLVAALEPGAAMLERYGGHKAAAGVSLRLSRLDEFKDWFEREAFAELPPEPWTPRLLADAEIDVGLVSSELAAELAPMAPHGIGNPAPRFLSRAVPVTGVRQARKGTIQMRVGPPPGVPAVAFRLDRPASSVGRTVDLVFGFGMRFFRGTESLQVTIEDLRNVSMDEKHK